MFMSNGDQDNLPISAKKAWILWCPTGVGPCVQTRRQLSHSLLEVRRDLIPMHGGIVRMENCSRPLASQHSLDAARLKSSKLLLDGISRILLRITHNQDHL